MMKQKLSVLLACCMVLAALPGCSSGTNSTSDTNSLSASTEVNGAAVPAEHTPESEEQLHITVESVDVTLDDLKANDYQVVLTVNLDKNPGVTNSEWGLQFEKNCTDIKASNMGMIVGTVHAVNDETHFLWTAWAGTETTDVGGLLKVGVTLPMDAAPGNTYTITYADTSATGAAHKWKCGTTDYVASDAVGWTDGVITVIE